MCTIWTDHEWGPGRFVENGNHPMMGVYQKFRVRCEQCHKETTVTYWLNRQRVTLPARLTTSEDDDAKEIS